MLRGDKNTCRRKAYFASRREAKRAMDQLQGHRRQPRPSAGGGRTRGKLNVYQCRHCGGWHVGTVVKRRKGGGGGAAAVDRETE